MLSEKKNSKDFLSEWSKDTEGKIVLNIEIWFAYNCFKNWSLRIMKKDYNFSVYLLITLFYDINKMLCWHGEAIVIYAESSGYINTPCLVPCIYK
jgi:hypothetical protein